MSPDPHSSKAPETRRKIRRRSKDRIRPLRIEGEELRLIPYIGVLEFAANHARSVGLAKPENVDRDTTPNTPGKEFGFSWQEIRASAECRHIDPVWLAELLPTICTCRREGSELGWVGIKEIQGNSIRFVIRSDEFMKFVTLLEMEALRDSVGELRLSYWIATIGALAAILLLLLELMKG